MVENWRTQAACRGMDPAVFHPEKMSPTYWRDLSIAHDTCNGCLVKEICLEDAIHDPAQIGVAGGTTVRTRKTMRVERGIADKRRVA
jgi:WhiB family redox-sensing transcriptional regulator